MCRHALAHRHRLLGAGQPRRNVSAAAAGESVPRLPLEADIPALGSKHVVINARSFEMGDETHLILVAMEIRDAQEAH